MEVPIRDFLVLKEIRELAHQYWEERGRPLGSPDVEWYRAVGDMEREHRTPCVMEIAGIGLERILPPLTDSERNEKLRR
jgi:Protein of unknown function (DUF2934)